MLLWTLFPRLSFFFLWSTPSTLLRQVQHIFRFPGLEDGLSIRTPRRSAIDCCVYQHRLLLNVCQCWRSGVINCIVNFQPKGKNSFLWAFHVLLSFNLDSVAAFTGRISRMYENPATAHSDYFGFTKYFPIF